METDLGETQIHKDAEGFYNEGDLQLQPAEAARNNRDSVPGVCPHLT